MTEVNIGNTTVSDFANTQTDYSVDPVSTDGVADQKETYWDNAKWSQYLGYYKSIPEFNATVDAKATWTVGKGFTADPMTTLLLNTVKGWGKDTFNSILQNCIRNYHIGGDAFCEIIRDKDKIFMNLKPLDPGTIRIVVNEKGLIKRYEQISKTKDSKNKTFNPEEIFHLARNRVADEIHGSSIVTPIENMILMRNEAMTDWKKVLHRNIAPVVVWHLDTDDTAKISAFKAQVEATKDDMENIFIPKGAVVPEVLSVAPNATMNPLPWIEALTKYFYQATGVPEIILGSSGEFTEASAKIAYLAFEQTIEEEQLFIEEQVLAQLNLQINLEFPASLENEMLSNSPENDQQVEQPQVQNRGLEQGDNAMQPNDTQAGMQGNK